VVNPVIINLYMLALFLLATLPFANQRLFGLVPVAAFKSGKPFPVRLGEWFVLFFIGLGMGLYLENSMGTRHPQEWEFYAVMLVVFGVLSVPGYLWQYQLKKLLLGK